jgi:hypothetical protein
MALVFECMPQCAQKLLDTADIVREAIYRQLRRNAPSLRYYWRFPTVVFPIEALRQVQ